MNAGKGRRILFLDVDGVLNNARILGYEDCSDRVVFHGMPFSLVSLTLVARAVQEFGLEIVLSSSWRSDWPLRLTHHVALEQALASVGLAVSDITPEEANLRYGTRGREIAAWLARNPDIESFVIVDDINDMPDLTRHLVLTEFEHGFNERSLRQLRRIMQSAGRKRLWKGWRR